VVLLINADLGKARYKLECMRNAMNDFNQQSGLLYEICCAFGIAQYDQNKHQNLDQLLHDGDERMYSFKQTMKDSL